MTVNITFWYPTSLPLTPEDRFALLNGTKPEAGFGYDGGGGNSTVADLTNFRVGCSNPGLTTPDSRPYWDALVPGNKVKVTFQGERGFEGGPQANEVRTFTVKANMGTVGGGRGFLTVEKSKTVHDYGAIKSIEFATPVVRIPSGLKPNTVYNF